MASLLALAAGLLFTLWTVIGSPFSSLQRTAADALFNEQEGSPNIVVVTIDEEALSEHGRIQEWPRALHAGAIDALASAGARVIVYDLLFADQGEDDDLLASSIAEAGAVVLPVVGASLTSGSDGSPVVADISRPTASLRDAGALLASANLLTDSDGRVRRVPLAVAGDDGSQYPSMALAAFDLQFGRTPPQELDLSADSLDLIGRTVPLEKPYSLRINYTGGVEQFPSLSFTDVERGRFDPAAVDGKVVLVGVIASGADIHSAPLLSQASGVEIHANALDTLFRARFLRPVSDWVSLSVLLSIVIAASLVLPRVRIWLGMLMVIVSAAAYVFVGIVAFRGGYILEFVDVPAALALVAVVGLAYRAMAERAGRNELQELFGRYVSPRIAEELVERADRGELHLGGDLREVTVLFADIRGFTPLAERTPPHELVDLLNRFFEVLVTEIMNRKGIVNKFAGDAIMAIWNAPDDVPDHAFLACSASIAAQRRLESLAPSGPVAKFGFGLHTGVALTGNVGAIGRLEYTVTGNSVNLAARLAQGAGPGEIWVSEETLQQVGDRLQAEPLPPQHLKGIGTPVSVYQLNIDVPESAARVEA
ncbi:MAG: adenylate/guanylate cyclase domain-containing protein [Dehalococcoidia bacterium]